jgi:hypothetical protein
MNKNNLQLLEISTINRNIAIQIWGLLKLKYLLKSKTSWR